MRLGDTTGRTRPRPLKFTLGEVPHGTLEPNRTCNIQCRSCYNLNRSFVKSLDTVKAEIDLLTEKRKLQVLSILGGEPTLHPQLPEIISYIKSKKVMCQLLTNGLALLQDRGNRFLDDLIGSGVDKIILHIDVGQSHVYEDIEKTRENLFSKMERKKVHFSLSLTIYNEDRGQIPMLVRRYSGYRYFDGILSVLARDPLPPKIQRATLLDEYASVLEGLKIEPSSYIPSNLDDEDVNWLIYIYFINANTGETLSVSTGLDKIYRRFYRLLKGRQAFVVSLGQSLAGPLSFLAGVGESSLNPKKMHLYRQLFWRSSFLRAIKLQYIAIQEPPEFDEQRNRLRICYHCPDATIRNGKLTPICLADKINPLEDDSKYLQIYKSWAEAVYSHMEEINSALDDRSAPGATR
jgi:hypothetical protein